MGGVNYWRAREAARREANLCVKCGKVSPASDYTRCRPCIDRDNANRKQQRAAKIAMRRCVMCGKEPADPNRRLCGRCRESDAKSTRAYRARHPEEVRARSAAAVVKARAAGKCLDCKKRKAEAGRVRCRRCRAARAAWWRERKRRRQLEAEERGEVMTTRQKSNGGHQPKSPSSAHPWRRRGLGPDPDPPTEPAAGAP